MQKWKATFIAAALAVLGTAAAAGNHAFEFRTLDAPGQAHTFLYDLNDHGAVVGQGYDAMFSVSSGLLFDRDAYSSYMVAGSTDSYLSSINNAGDVAGAYTDEHGVGQIFVVRRDMRRDFLPTPDTLYATAGISDNGALAGTFTEDWSAIRGFVHDGRSITAFDVPGAFMTQAFKANARGDIVGWYFDGRSHGYVRDKAGNFTSIDYPGAFLTRAFGINDRGEVTGYYQAVRRGPIEGFVWHDGRFLATVAYPGSTFTVPQGINNRGELAGYYRDDAGVYHGFIATRY